MGRRATTRSSWRKGSRRRRFLSRWRKLGIVSGFIISILLLLSFTEEPEEAEVHRQLPPVRPELQTPLRGRQAPKLRRSGATVLRPPLHPGKRRPPFPRRLQRPAVRQAGLRVPPLQPAVGRDPLRRHLRRARRLLRPRPHSRRRRPQPRRRRRPAAVQLQVRPPRRQDPCTPNLALDPTRDSVAWTFRAVPEFGVRALLHSGHREEDLQPSRVFDQA
ncbi:unnamed protein product [Linum tenue]|uniref:Uncharacterized protein n=1 Tax=Linum tenue TaxID=586396 RepID=A0AAV0MYQ7_9ROSI|nr:unnamed protein product [Linum tenue]